jgi:UDP:flavonoid glycosyltransferase YjiC (YdhE family)
MIPPQPRLGGLYHLASHYLTEQIFWQFARPAVNRWRQAALDLPPYPLLGVFDQLYQADQFFLYGYSPLVVPKPANWPDSAQVTGYWFLDHPADWQPPADLQDFLTSGDPPVYVGFGSMPDRNAAEITEITIEALAQTGRRGLLLTGWGGLTNADLPDYLFKIEAAPHDWLFPRMAAVVHHGGAGTTAAGLRAGVPSLVVPYFGDQFFWGQRVAELEVGPRPLARQKLSAEQ